MKVSNYHSFFLLFCITFSLNAMNVNVAPGDNTPLLPTIPKKSCKQRVLLHCLRTLIGITCLTGIVAALFLPNIHHNHCTNNVNWDRFETNCSLETATPINWATVQCQHDLMSKLLRVDGCTPVCIERNSDTQSTIPVDWQEATDALWHHGCDQEGLDGQNLYMLCDNSTWFDRLKKVFTGNNISWCEIFLESSNDVGVMIPEGYWWWAIDPSAYQVIIDHPQEAQSEACEDYFEYAKSLDPCNVGFTSGGNTSQGEFSQAQLNQEYKKYLRRKKRTQKNHKK